VRAVPDRESRASNLAFEALARSRVAGPTPGPPADAVGRRDDDRDLYDDEVRRGVSLPVVVVREIEAQYGYASDGDLPGDGWRYVTRVCAATADEAAPLVEEEAR
jgi:hypothetical protein